MFAAETLRMRMPAIEGGDEREWIADECDVAVIRVNAFHCAGLLFISVTQGFKTCMLACNGRITTCRVTNCT